MLRRALLAGMVIAAVVGAPLLAAVVLGGGTGAQGLAVMILAVALGGLVATVWLLVGTLLDVLAGEAPGRYRAVSLAVVGGTSLLTFVLAAAAGA